jgi:hypothetical protein
MLKNGARPPAVSNECRHRSETPAPPTRVSLNLRALALDLCRGRPQGFTAVVTGLATPLAMNAGVGDRSGPRDYGETAGRRPAEEGDKACGEPTSPRVGTSSRALG